MFSRKLKALGYHHPEQFNISDQDEFRNCIVWLEDQKIRLYKIEDRTLLRDIKNPNWNDALEKYLMDLSSPVDKTNNAHVLSWLLSHAVRLEFSESADIHRKKHVERQSRKEVSTDANGHIDTDELGAITSENPDLKAGIASLSKILSLPHHHDHIIVLQAIQKMIHERLSEDAIDTAKKAAGTKKKGKSREGDFIPIAEVDLGFETNDKKHLVQFGCAKVVGDKCWQQRDSYNNKNNAATRMIVTDSAINEASKILRLLHLRELRDLQTYINKAIVSVQTITANPKTDQSLGRVGR